MGTSIKGVAVAKDKIIEPFMVDIIQQIHGRQVSHAKIAKLINFEFALGVTEHDVDRYFDPTIKEEEEDLKLIYEHTVK